MNEANLLLLAGYLEALPEDYEHFHMAVFHGDTNRFPFSVTGNHCGTVACAVGHAVYVDGLPNPKYSETWTEYSHRIFGIFDEEWEWCFSGEWEYTDNTPRAAAERIRYLVANGLPGDWYEQMYGK